MQQYHGRPAVRETRETNSTKQYASAETQGGYRERRTSGEPAKFNSRTDQRRISWENDLYERQSI